MDNIIVTNVLAFVIGLFSSLVFWWILFFVIVPEVEFEEHIFKREYKYNNTYNKLGCEYVFKIQNVGYRTILDVEFFARLRIKGLRRENPGNFINDYLPLGDKRIPYIEMPYRFLCNDAQREGAKPSPGLASRLFCHVPLHDFWYGVYMRLYMMAKRKKKRIIGY